MSYYKKGDKMEKLDYKKQDKDLYLPKAEPVLIDVHNMKFIWVAGKGNPNSEKGEYQEALQLLYALSFTIKMSKMGTRKIENYFDYVVPPLEGFWWNDGEKNVDYEKKDKFMWILLIRQPEFVTKEVFEWACEEVKNKKGINVEKAEFGELKEGLCVQMMHIGPYDDEPKTLEKIEEYIAINYLKNDIGNVQNGVVRRHHEIYLSDPRRTKPENLKTVIRIPVKKEK